MALCKRLIPFLNPFVSASPYTITPTRTRTVLTLGHIQRPILLSPILIYAVRQFGIPSIFIELWESILRAVPKQKTPHRKKRQRFLAGKALKDVTALNKCSACGNVKRAHLLCPFCVNEIRDMWGKKGSKDSAEEGALAGV